MTSPYPALVEGPTPQPWRYGLLSVANLVVPSSDHERNGVQYRSPYCSGASVWLDPCFTGVAAVDKLPTDTGQTGDVSGDPFVVYTYLSCRETTLADMLSKSEVALAISEQAAVEEHFWTSALAVPGCTVLNTTAGAPGALSVVGGVGALESAIADVYGGQATIHADRGLAAFMAARNQIEKAPGGNSLQTILGTDLAFYGGSPNTSPTGVVAPNGTSWMYVTSRVTLRKFPAEVLPGVEHVLRLPTNEPMALAERTWVATTECACFAVLVSVSCAC